jgi:hypothetical protein
VLEVEGPEPVAAPTLAAAEVPLDPLWLGEEQANPTAHRTVARKMQRMQTILSGPPGPESACHERRASVPLSAGVLGGV